MAMDIGSVEQAETTRRLSQLCEYGHLRGHRLAAVKPRCAVPQQVNQGLGLAERNHPAFELGNDRRKQDGLWQQPAAKPAGIKLLHFNEALARFRRISLPGEFGKVAEHRRSAVKGSS